jgi:hypothetical protein
MSMKNDIGAVTLTAAEISAASAKGAHPSMLLGQAKQMASELHVLLGELIKELPAGANKTTLTTIQSTLV